MLAQFVVATLVAWSTFIALSVVGQVGRARNPITPRLARTVTALQLVNTSALVYIFTQLKG